MAQSVYDCGARAAPPRAPGRSACGARAAAVPLPTFPLAGSDHLGGVLASLQGSEATSGLLVEPLEEWVRGPLPLRRTRPPRVHGIRRGHRAVTQPSANVGCVQPVPEEGPFRYRLFPEEPLLGQYPKQATGEGVELAGL